MSRPGKRSEGVKKETMRQVPEEANRVEKRYFSGRPANVNIWGFFSRSEVQPGEEISSL